MNRIRRWNRWRFAAAAVLLAAAPVAAQEYRGNLFVEVKDDAGKPVAGAELTLAGGDFSRASTTGADGKARFVRLEPGAYRLTASAKGFAKVTVEQVDVATFQSASLQVRLTPESQLSQTVTVTAESPLLDQRRMGTATVLTQDEVSQIPTSRDPWAVLSTVPGVTTDRVNVAGNEAGQQSNFVGNGDDGTNTTWVMDGVEFTDLGAVGSSPTYFDFNTFEEIGFVTGGADVDQANGGARLNFTTKQGTNEFSGNLRLWYTSKGLQSDVKTITQPEGVVVTPPDPETFFPGNNLPPNNQVNEVFEKNVSFGGPILKDKIWYWVGFGQNDIDNQVANVSDKTKLKNTTAKIHGQVGARWNWKLFYSNGNKAKDGRGAAVTRPAETTWIQKGPTPIYTAYASALINPNWDLSLQAGHVDGKFSLTPKGGLDAQIFNDENNVWSGSYLLYDTVRPQDQFVVRGSNFFDTAGWEHEVKYGYRYKKTTVESLSKWSNLDNFVYSASYVYLYRERDYAVDMEHVNAWVGDTVTKGNWAVTAGLSYTEQQGKNTPADVAAVGLCPTCLPGVSYAGGSEVFTWKDVSPRVGATYTFDTRKRLLLRANYAQYVDQLYVSDINYDNPAASYAYLVHAFADANDNRKVDPGEFSTDCADALGGSVVACDPTLFADRIDPDYEAPRVREFIFGAEVELARDFTIAANILWRNRDRDRWIEGNLDGRPVAAAGPLYDVPHFEATGELRPIDASFYDCSATVSGTFPDGTPYSEPFCTLSPAGELLTNDGSPSFLTNRPGYEQRYKGLEITATKRLSNRWMLRGYVAVNDWTQEFSGTQGISDPTNFQGGTTEPGGEVSIPSVGSGTKDGVWLGTSRWQANVNGLYQLPRDMTLSGNLYVRQGYGIPYMHRASGKDVQIGEIGDARYDTLWTFDLGFAKNVKLQKGGVLELRADMFNVFDRNTVLSQKPRVNSAGNTNAITETLSPRIIRVGASLNF
ncbi:MAG TPA: carboxypeptidase regulatory-like domain-containing protein [Candidatus Polarisedimenticolaceae bacterium]